MHGRGEYTLGAKFLIPLMRMHNPKKTPKNSVDGTNRFDFDGDKQACGTSYKSNPNPYYCEPGIFPKYPRSVSGHCCRPDKCHIVQGACCECENDESALEYNTNPSTTKTAFGTSYNSGGSITIPSTKTRSVSGSVGSTAHGCTRTSYSFTHYTYHQRGSDTGCGVGSNCPCCHMKAPCKPRRSSTSTYKLLFRNRSLLYKL